MTLHGAVDDATGTALALHFPPTEDLHGYAMVFDQVFTTWGLPVACYGDGTNILIRTDPHWTLAEELHGAQDPTHLGRVLVDLGIGYIRARSPQAKGRIERLWGTLQDRLVSELRVRGIATREAANAFLPLFLADYNRRFAHAPADPTPAWRRPPRDPAPLVSCRYTRTVARDNTVRLGARWLQLPPGLGGRSYAGRRVELREGVDGRLFALEAGRVLAEQAAPGPDFVLRPRADSGAQQRQRRRAARPPSAPAGSTRPPSPRTALTELAQALRRPARPHPWRRGFAARERARQRALTPKGG
jgi:hypothetical protein